MGNIGSYVHPGHWTIHGSRSRDDDVETLGDESRVKVPCVLDDLRYGDGLGLDRDRRDEHIQTGAVTERGDQLYLWLRRQRDRGERRVHGTFKHHRIRAADDAGA